MHSVIELHKRNFTPSHLQMMVIIFKNLKHTDKLQNQYTALGRFNQQAEGAFSYFGCSGLGQTVHSNVGFHGETQEVASS